MSICKNCFHSYVCEQFNEQRECDNKKCHFANDHFVSADEINHLQAENERLEKANGLFEYLNKAVYLQRDIPFEFKTIEAKNKAINKYIDKMCDIQTAKAESYKEFAEKVKENHFKYFNFIFSKPAFDKLTDNLCEELVGKDNGNS